MPSPDTPYDIRHTLLSMRDASPAAARPGSFSEKAFYLNEFRGRTLAVAAHAADLGAPAALEAVLKELEANGTRVVLLSDSTEAAAGVLGTAVLPGDAAPLEGAVWRSLQASPRVAVELSAGAAFARSACDVARRLGVPKLVWIDDRGPLLRPNGVRRSFVDLGELRALLRDDAGGPRAALLREFEMAIEAGLAAVNLCALDAIGDDLFSYAGAGTLFTRERYLELRPLTIDDFDAADDLVARGVAEGYLASRSPAEVEQVLSNGFGAFVEGRHLAGIGALIQHAAHGAGEIVSLYTLTRFLGEGVGGHLVQFAVRRAAGLGCTYVFACTTSERVVRFFERQGFAIVPQEAVPPEKWRHYDPARRASVHCLRREIAPG